MRVYRPNLLALPDGGRAQVFAANVVHIDDELVALGELIPDPRRGLPYGTPVHSLLIHLDDRAPAAFELNDQGNTVSASDVVRGALTWALTEELHVGGGRAAAGREHGLLARERVVALAWPR